MLRRNLLIGGLVAGAFVLPTLAVAGVVSGVCSNCHTMHASQDGGTTVANDTLLKASGCAGCHADPSATNVVTTGLGTGGTGTGAPQVDYEGATMYINAAGYFNTAASDSNQHNPSNLANVQDVPAMTTIPGSTALLAGNAVSCEQCHPNAGHHTTQNYRMLEYNAAGTAAQAHQYRPNGQNVFPGDRTSIVYDATNMNLVCARCHGNFHTAPNQGAAQAWIRHPTDIAVNGSAGPSVQDTFTQTDSVVVGDAGATRVVMCLSCHVPHGGPNADLLSFTYAGTNDAGNSLQGEGCETCHSYGTAGM